MVVMDDYTYTGYPDSISTSDSTTVLSCGQSGYTELTIEDYKSTSVSSYTVSYYSPNPIDHYIDLRLKLIRMKKLEQIRSGWNENINLIMNKKNHTDIRLRNICADGRGWKN